MKGSTECRVYYRGGIGLQSAGSTTGVVWGLQSAGSTTGVVWGLQSEGSTTGVVWT